MEMLDAKNLDEDFVKPLDELLAKPVIIVRLIKLIFDKIIKIYKKFFFFKF